MGFFLQAVLLLIDAGQKIGHFCVRAPVVITGPFINFLLVTRHNKKKIYLVLELNIVIIT